MDAVFDVELQVYAHCDLADQHEHDIGNKLGVDVLGELPSLVLVAEEVTCDSEEGAEGLDGNVPFRSYHLIACQCLVVSCSFLRY